MVAVGIGHWDKFQDETKEVSWMVLDSETNEESVEGGDFRFWVLPSLSKVQWVKVVAEEYVIDQVPFMCYL